MAAPAPVFQVYERADGKWDWRLVAVNGEIVATSGGQGFRDATDAGRAVGTLEMLIVRGLELRLEA